MKVMLLDQQVYGLPGDHHRTDGVAGLGGADLQFSLAAPDGFADGYAFLLQIQVSPEKGKQFSPCASRWSIPDKTSEGHCGLLRPGGMHRSVQTG